MTSTYDHRIIQGAESGSFLRRIEELLQGEDDFYESVATDLGLEPAVVTSAHPAAASGSPAAAIAAPSATDACRPLGKAGHRAAPGGPGGDLPAQGATAPTATLPPASTRSAPSRRAIRRSSPRTST